MGDLVREVGETMSLSIFLLLFAAVVALVKIVVDESRWRRVKSYNLPAAQHPFLALIFKVEQRPNHWFTVVLFAIHSVFFFFLVKS